VAPAAPEQPVLLPPAGGRGIRLVAAAVAGVLGALQIAVGLQIGRPTTAVAGGVIVLLAVSLAVRAGRGPVIGSGGVQVPGWPRGADVPWSGIERLLVRPAPFGRVRLRMVRADHPPGLSRPITVLSPDQARELLPAIRELAAARDVPVTELDDDA
jgi:hypothetical protein